MSYHVAEQLRKKGYDVRSAFEDGQLELPDEHQFTYATGKQCALVTYNIKDFATLVKKWFSAGRSHYGVILIKEETISRDDIGGQVRALAVLLEAHPEIEAFCDRCDYLRPVS